MLEPLTVSPNHHNMWRTCITETSYCLNFHLMTRNVSLANYSCVTWIRYDRDHNSAEKRSSNIKLAILSKKS